MKLRELATKPSPDQFERIAQAIDPDARITSTRQLTGGISCRMDVVTLESSSQPTREVVIRQYGPWHKDDDPHPGEIESMALGHLSANDINAPRLVLSEEATEIMGAPTIVTSLIDGKSIVQPADVHDWAEQLVGAIVPVHAAPVTDELRMKIPALYPAIDRLFSRSEPTAEIAGHLLGLQLWQAAKEMWPNVDKSGDCLIHADYWPGNTVWKDDQLAAIVDWEEPRIGEPTWDIAIVVQDAAVFGMDIEQTVLNHHAKISDRPLRDYEFWRMYIAMTEMPDPGVWVDGFQALGGGNITADEVRANHTATVDRMLGVG